MNRLPASALRGHLLFLSAMGS